MYVEILGNLDMNKLFAATTPERMIKCLVYEYEKFLRERLPACEAATGKTVETSCTILDLNNVGLSNFYKVKNYVGEASTIGQNYCASLIRLVTRDGTSALETDPVAPSTCAPRPRDHGSLLHHQRSLPLLGCLVAHQALVGRGHRQEDLDPRPRLEGPAPRPDPRREPRGPIRRSVDGPFDVRRRTLEHGGWQEGCVSISNASSGLFELTPDSPSTFFLRFSHRGRQRQVPTVDFENAQRNLSRSLALLLSFPRHPWIPLLHPLCPFPLVALAAQPQPTACTLAFAPCRRARTSHKPKTSTSGLVCTQESSGVVRSEKSLGVRS